MTLTWSWFRWPQTLTRRKTVFRVDDSETNLAQMILNAWQAILKTINGPESNLTQKVILDFAFRLKQSVLVLKGRSHSEFKSTLSDVVHFYRLCLAKKLLYCLIYRHYIRHTVLIQIYSIWDKSDIDDSNEHFLKFIENSKVKVIFIISKSNTEIFFFSKIFSELFFFRSP